MAWNPKLLQPWTTSTVVWLGRVWRCWWWPSLPWAGPISVSVPGYQLAPELYFPFNTGSSAKVVTCEASLGLQCLVVITLTQSLSHSATQYSNSLRQRGRTQWTYIFIGVPLHLYRNKLFAVLVKHWSNLFSKFVLQSVKSPESVFKLSAVLPADNATVLTTFKHNQSLDTFNLEHKDMVLQGERTYCPCCVVLLLLGGFD